MPLTARSSKSQSAGAPTKPSAVVKTEPPKWRGRTDAMGNRTSGPRSAAAPEAKSWRCSAPVGPETHSRSPRWRNCGSSRPPLRRAPASPMICVGQRSSSGALRRCVPDSRQQPPALSCSSRVATLHARPCIGRQCSGRGVESSWCKARVSGHIASHRPPRCVGGGSACWARGLFIVTPFVH